MTRIKGQIIVKTQCCSRVFAAPNYISMNFRADEYWTDGSSYGALMANDTGLRQCICGKFILESQVTQIGVKEKSELPFLSHVPSEELVNCLEKIEDTNVEIAARIAFWWHLNEPYKEAYRAHQGTPKNKPYKKGFFALFNPSKTEAKRKSIELISHEDKNIKIPNFNLRDEQRTNMQRLYYLIKTIKSDSNKLYLKTVMAELLREQGFFNETLKLLSETGHRNHMLELIYHMATCNESAPIRYKLDESPIIF